MNTLYESLTRRQEDHTIEMTGEEEKLNFGLAAVIYEWSRGTAFKEITDMTKTQEGSIVRCITRLDEVLKDFR